MGDPRKARLKIEDDNEQAKMMNVDIAVKFLAEYSFMYEVPNTNIFIENVLEKIPNMWTEALLSLTLEELRQVPFGFYKEEWPASLCNFLVEANELGKYRYQYKFQNHKVAESIRVPAFIKSKTPIKKLYEIQSMAALVNQLCRDHDCGIVIDIGSGLGYLDQIIHYNFGLTTVGFESEPKFSDMARQRISLGRCQKNMYHINQKIDNTVECKEIIKKVINEVYCSEEICDCGALIPFSEKAKRAKNIIMVGLHCCGELIQSMMELFNHMPEFKLFLCAGCCYHKLRLTSFPMSQVVQKAVSAAQVGKKDWSVSIPGLRLGSQRTRDYWAKQSYEDFVYEEKCLSFAAVMWSFVREENIVWRRPKRRLMKKNIVSFKDFALITLDSIDAEKKTEHMGKLYKLYEEKQPLFPCIRILNLLQTLLQPIWEIVILEDRIAYFQENAVDTDVFVLCDEAVSPRNLILYGIKR